MIWFDASLNKPADDRTLQRGIAAMLGVAEESVDVVYSITEIEAAPVTCVVDNSTADPYSQLITLYLPEPLPSLDIVESASRLAAVLDRSLLLANDATADPYSFVHVSSAGWRSVVLVDPDELDGNGRHVIREHDTLSEASST